MESWWINQVLNEQPKQSYEIIKTTPRIELYSKLKDAIEKADEPEKNLAIQAAKLDQAIESLNKGKQEYYNVQGHRDTVLVLIAKQIIKCERKGYAQIAQDLEEILLEVGVQRYVPQIGSPIVSGKCIAIGKMQNSSLPHGSVATVMAPGFCTSGGIVILPSEVFRSVQPEKSSDEKVICKNTDAIVP
jgi:hypothetical protein